MKHIIPYDGLQNDLFYNKNDIREIYLKKIS